MIKEFITLPNFNNI